MNSPQEDDRHRPDPVPSPRINRRGLLAALAGAGAIGTFAAYRFALSDGGERPAVRRTPAPLSWDYAGLPPLFARSERGRLEDLAKRSDDADFAGLLHWLRVFGRESSALYRPDEAREIVADLTSAPRLTARFNRPSPLVCTPHGARYRIKSVGRGRRMEVERPSHPFQVLAVFGEIGLPSTTPLDVCNDPATIADLLYECLAESQVSRGAEPTSEWAVSAMAQYLVPGERWRNQWGETLSLDQVVEAAIAQPVEQYSCLGTHLLSMLATLLQINDQSPILRRPLAAQVEAECVRFNSILEATQLGSGSWSSDWSGPQENLINEPTTEPLQATGHILEAQALLPSRVRLPAARLRRAGQCLFEMVRELDDETARVRYCPVSHAVKVLLEWPASA